MYNFREMNNRTQGSQKLEKKISQLENDFLIFLQIAQSTLKI